MPAHRKSSVPVAPSPVVAAPREEIDPLCWILAALVSGLTFIRWWQPTEGTAQGDTLGIVLGWFVVLALMGWIGLRGTVLAVRVDGLQMAVWLLAGGHVLSGAVVMATTGDKRAALNLMWEWLALAVAFPLLRLLLGTPAARREWTVIALGAVVTLSTYGLIQRAYLIPQTIAEYQTVRDELDAAERDAASEATTGISYKTQSRIQGLQAKLLRLGLEPQMLSGSSRVMFEGRLLHSTEVLGRFALANTFAGLLLVWCVILILQTVARIRAGFEPQDESSGIAGEMVFVGSTPPKSRIETLKILFLVACVIFVGYCLLLTKSRTAYLGTVTGLGVWTLAVGLGSRPRFRTLFVWSALALLALSAVIVVAGLTGGLDHLVLAEAPKSLQYRLEYWWSSLQVIGDSPWLGVGPGQFRQHYLVHKLPRSSEEIADPHNLVLDVWANGGLLALIGLGWLTLELFRSLFKSNSSARSCVVDTTSSGPIPANPNRGEASPGGVIPIGPSVRDAGISQKLHRKIISPITPHSAPSKRTGIGNVPISVIPGTGWRNPLRIGGLGSLVALWLVGFGLEATSWMLLAGWTISVVLLDRALPRLAPRAEFWMAAGCGLLVHLLGAGGIAMPAIVQLLVVVALFCQPVPSEIVSAGIVQPSALNSVTRQPSILISGIVGGFTVVSGLILFAGCFATAARPAWLCRAALEQGDYTTSPQKREQFWRQAAESDPLAIEPWEKLSAFAFSKWKFAQQPDERDFRSAIEAQQAVIKRNPLSFHGYRTLGEYYTERAGRTNSAQDKESAVASMKSAMLRYPHHAELLAIAAETFAVAGEVDLAAQTARDALDQDDINHQAQHTDKWLSAEFRKRTERLAGKPVSAEKSQ